MSYSMINTFMGRSGQNLAESMTKAQYTATRSLQLAALLTSYYAFGRPSVLLGYFIPLYNVQSYEIARSYEQLQYRSVGNEFLAQQKGGNLGVRVDVILTGPQQYAYLTLLRILFEIGISKNERYTQDISEPASKIPQTSLTVKRYGLSGNFNKTVYGALEGIGKISVTNAIATGEIGTIITKPQQVGSETIMLKDSLSGKEVSIKDDFDINSVKEGRDYEFYDVGDESWRDRITHNTFPLSTPDEIIFDCYLETIIFRRDITKGPNVLRATLLFRQFNPPPIIDKAEMELYWKKRELKGTGKTTDIVPKIKVTSKSSYKNMSVRDLERIDLIMNGIWRAQKILRDAAYGKYAYGKQIPLNVRNFGANAKALMSNMFKNKTVSVGGFS